MATYVLPTPERVVRLLNGLLAVQTSVRPQKQPTRLADPLAMALYHGHDDQLAVFLVCDVAAANYLGSALSLLPPAVVQEDIKKQIVGNTTLDNLREVLNVGVNLFTHPQSHRLKLNDVTVTGNTNPLSAELKGVVSRAVSRLDLEVDVSRYGCGRMVLGVAQAG